MRCLSCDCILSDFESTRKDTHGQYIDMCNDCFDPIKNDVLVVEREDLRYNDSTEEEFDFLEETES